MHCERHTPPLEAFLERLASRPDDATVQNPYRRPGRLHNLRAYLAQLSASPGRRILLVGEAPGYRGCLLTGIPFSSPRLLREAPHGFLRRLRPQLQLHGDQPEASASLVWLALARRRSVPLAWNAYPFHPHRAGEPQSNRAPNAEELREGAWYLQQLARWFEPQWVTGVGNRGYRAARTALPQSRVGRIRHPSYGGKADFLAGMDRLYRGRLSAGPG